MRPILDFVEPAQPWAVPLDPDNAAVAHRVLRLHSRRSEPTRTVVELDGEVDMLTTALLAERLDEHLNEDVRQIVLDLSGLRFLSASGLSVLVAADECARACGAAMSLAGCDRAVGRVFDAAGLRTHFDFIDDHLCLAGQG